MGPDYAREVEVLDTAANSIAANPEWEPAVIVTFLRSYANGLREHTHEPA